jgi:hypothetical protein
MWRIGDGLRQVSDLKHALVKKLEISSPVTIEEALAKRQGMID